MSDHEALVDTDILSALMRRDLGAAGRARSYLNTHGHLTFSIITRYEILRGLKAKTATAQLATFDVLCRASAVLPLSDAVVETASDVYAVLHRAGALVADADLLIASTALVHGLAVVTNNTSHFSRIPGLTVLNWLRPA